MNKRKLLAQIMNNQKNVKYSDFVTLVEAFGFRYARSNGSHNIYELENLPEILNIQSKKGEAKPYQVNHFLMVVERFNLKMEGEE